MGGIGAVLALLVPTVVGAGILRLWIYNDDRPGSWFAAGGLGYVLGMTLNALALGLQGAIFGSLMPWGLLTAGALLAVWLVRQLDSQGQKSAFFIESLANSIRNRFRENRWATVITGLFLIALILRFISLAAEHFSLGIYGWDAWSTWAYRARVWVETERLVPFLNPDLWLSDRNLEAGTLPASHYPRLVSLIMAWPALVAGGWVEWVVTLPWLGLWVALGLGLFGHARLWGLSTPAAVVGTWMLLSMPLVGSQAAVAGYADLWLATLLGFAFMAFLRWARNREPLHGGLALIFAALAIATKSEGLVWTAFFVPAVVMVWFSWRGGLALVLLVVLVLLGLYSSGGIDADLPLLGSISISLDRIGTARTGAFEFLFQEGVLKPLLIHFFVFGTWHLLLFVIVVTVVSVIVSLARDDNGLLAERWQQAAFIWVLSAVAAFYLLFFWTPAAEWVRLGTSGNRIMLHFAPALVFWFMTLWHSIERRPAS